MTLAVEHQRLVVLFTTFQVRVLIPFAVEVCLPSAVLSFGSIVAITEVTGSRIFAPNVPEVSHENSVSVAERRRTASVSHYLIYRSQFSMQDLLEKGAASSRGSAPQKGSRRPVFCMNHPEHVSCMHANFGRDRA